MNDRFELAGAYLDGAATPAERAQVEADPELLELVEQLRAVRDHLADVTPPTALTRELALSAALAVADDLAAGIDASDTHVDQPAPATVVPLSSRRRPSMQRVLSVAAAFLAIGVVGVVAVTGLRGAGGGDDVATSPLDDEAFTLEAGSDGDHGDDGDAEFEMFADEGMADALEAPAAELPRLESADGEAGDTASDSAPIDDADVADSDPAEEVDPPAVTSTMPDGGADARIDITGLDDGQLVTLADELFARSEEEGEPPTSPCPTALTEVIAPVMTSGRDATLGLDDDRVVVVADDGCELLASVPRERSGG